MFLQIFNELNEPFQAQYFQKKNQEVVSLKIKLRFTKEIACKNVISRLT